MNIQMKWFKDGEGWKNQYPITKASNVFDMEGNSLEDVVRGLETKVEKGELIKNVADYGVEANTGLDVSVALEQALNQGGDILIPEGEYIVANPIVISNSARIIANGVKIKYTGQGVAIRFNGSEDTAKTITNNVAKSSTTLNLSSSGGVVAGDWILIQSDELVSPNARTYDTKIEWNKVIGVSGNTITLLQPTKLSHSSSLNARINVQNLLEDCSITGITVENANGNTNAMFGIVFDRCINFDIINNRAYNFHYSNFEVRNSVMGTISNNHFFTNYSATLQYGITIHTSFLINVGHNIGGSERTAIDVTRSSRNINVNNNLALKGNVSMHTSFDNIYANNIVQNGRMNIRGIGNTIIGNKVNSPDSECISIEEAGKDGPNYFLNNELDGMMGTRLFGFGSVFSGNICNARSVRYGAILRYEQADPNNGKLTISNNTLIAWDFYADRGIEADSLANSVNDVLISGNTIHGAKIGVYVRSNRTDHRPRNLTIIDNNIRVSEIGIAFGLTNKVRIQGNTIAGSSKLEAGIQLAYQTTNNNVVSIKDNFIESATVGITHQAGGSGNYNSAIVKDNIYLSTDTAEQLARFNLLP